MLTSLHIKNFRLFQDLTLSPLSRVNLIAGRNNSGKTALLEAIYLLFVRQADFTAFPAALRQPSTGDNFDNFWAWLPYQKDNTLTTVIEAIGVENLNQKVTLGRSSENNPKSLLISYSITTAEKEDFIGSTVLPYNLRHRVSGSFISSERDKRPAVSIFSTYPTPLSEDADVFNRLVLQRKKNRLLELLRVLEPRLTDLQYLKISDVPLIYAELDLPELIPVTQLGQGFMRLFRFFTEMLIAKSEVVLIDEVENGLHHSILPEVWRGMATLAAQEDLQIFATTHSLECLQAAHEVFQEMPSYDFAFHRLQRVKGKVQAVTHDRQMIEVATETELEIR